MFEGKAKRKLVGIDTPEVDDKLATEVLKDCIDQLEVWEMGILWKIGSGTVGHTLLSQVSSETLKDLKLRLQPASGYAHFGIGGSMHDQRRYHHVTESLSLSRFVNLEKLEMASCLLPVETFAAFQHLKTLELGNVAFAKNNDELAFSKMLAGLPNLRSLDLTDVWQLTPAGLDQNLLKLDIADLAQAGLGNLESLKIHWLGGQLVRTPEDRAGRGPIAPLRGLRTLRLQEKTDLNTLFLSKRFPILHTLDIKFCFGEPISGADNDAVAKIGEVEKLVHKILASHHRTLRKLVLPTSRFMFRGQGRQLPAEVEYYNSVMRPTTKTGKPTGKASKIPKYLLTERDRWQATLKVWAEKYPMVEIEASPV